MADILRKQGRTIGSSGGSGGGLTQEEHDWLESLASYTPNMYDINPLKTTSTSELTGGKLFIGCRKIGGETTKSYLPVCGYDKIAFNGSVATCSFRFVYADGTTDPSYTSINNGTWTNYYTIPDNAVYVQIEQYYDTSNHMTGDLYYSLLTKDSPYNPG